MAVVLPRLYPIVDEGVLRERGLGLRQLAVELRAAGVELVQYRNKSGSPQEVLRNAALIRDAMAGSGCRLIMNDRADIAVLGWVGWGACGAGGFIAGGCEGGRASHDAHSSHETRSR